MRLPHLLCCLTLSLTSTTWALGHFPAPYIEQAQIFYPLEGLDGREALQSRTVLFQPAPHFKKIEPADATAQYELLATSEGGETQRVQVRCAQAPDKGVYLSLNCDGQLAFGRGELRGKLPLMLFNATEVEATQGDSMGTLPKGERDLKFEYAPPDRIFNAAVADVKVTTRNWDSLREFCFKDTQGNVIDARLVRMQNFPYNEHQGKNEFYFVFSEPTPATFRVYGLEFNEAGIPYELDINLEIGDEDADEPTELIAGKYHELEPSLRPDVFLMRRQPNGRMNTTLALTMSLPQERQLSSLHPNQMGSVIDGFGDQTECTIRLSPEDKMGVQLIFTNPPEGGKIELSSTFNFISAMNGEELRSLEFAENAAGNFELGGGQFSYFPSGIRKRNDTPGMSLRIDKLPDIEGRIFLQDADTGDIFHSSRQVTDQLNRVTHSFLFEGKRPRLQFVFTQEKSPLEEKAKLRGILPLPPAIKQVH